MITHLELDILECDIKWALGSITVNKASGGDGIPVAVWWPFLERVPSGVRLRSSSGWAPWLEDSSAGVCHVGTAAPQHSLGDPPRSRIQPVFPSLVGGFSTTGSPGMPTLVGFNSLYSFVSQPSHRCASMHMCTHVHMYACLRKHVCTHTISGCLSLSVQSLHILPHLKVEFKAFTV